VLRAFAPLVRAAKTGAKKPPEATPIVTTEEPTRSDVREPTKPGEKKPG
jgi:hypothetical protein